MAVNLLLDTHTLVWALTQPTLLSNTARGLLSNPDHDVFVSSATPWEMAIKFRSGKFPEAGSILPAYHAILTKARFREIQITGAHGIRAAGLQTTHKDPFDRILVAQSLEENLTLVSADPLLTGLGAINVVW
jgi:PIN domain nuclease of toxin-antitoxin system